MPRDLRPAVLALFLAASAAAAEKPAAAKTPAQAVAAAVRFTPPKGWTADSYANGVDPVVRYENLSDAIMIRLFGAPGSDYASPAEFMRGPAASEEGAPSVSVGTATVAGRRVELRRQRFPIEISDPHRSGPVSKLRGTEVFCVLPLKDGRFAVLIYRRESPIPDMHRKGEIAWEAFLKTVRPR